MHSVEVLPVKKNILMTRSNSDERPCLDTIQIKNFNNLLIDDINASLAVDQELHSNNMSGRYSNRS